MGAIDNKIAIVTGGGGGIGSAIVRRLAAKGARLAIADVDGEAAQACTAEVTTKKEDAFSLSLIHI